MPFFTTRASEWLEPIVQLLGIGFAGFLIKLGLRARKQRTIETVGLMDQNVLWAKDMMDRFEKQIAELKERVTELERENRKLHKVIENYRIENFLLEQKVAKLQENAQTQTGT